MYYGGLYCIANQGGSVCIKEAHRGRGFPPSSEPYLPTFTVCEDLTLWCKVPRKWVPSNYTGSKPTGTSCILKYMMGQSCFVNIDGLEQ